MFKKLLGCSAIVFYEFGFIFEIIITFVITDGALSDFHHEVKFVRVYTPYHQIL